MTAAVPALALALCVVVLVIGLALYRSEAAGADRVVGRLSTMRRPEQSLLPAIRDTVARRYAQRVLALTSSKRRTLTRHRIDAAGRPDGLTMETYAGAKAVSTVSFGLAGLLLALITNSPLFVFALGYFGWLRVDLSLLAQAKRRQTRIDRDLPDFLDVLAVTVSAGLGFRAALARVADALGGPLREEIKTALQQMGYGVARRAAFEGIRERNDSPALSQFMSALLQAEDLGSPLADALSAIAADMRRSFAQNARAEAARAVPRVSVVIATVMVPGFLVLMLGALFTASGTNFGSILG
jgi:tight adherence protein C